MTASLAACLTKCSDTFNANQQIFGLNAPYGFLTVMFEKDWQIHSWFVWRDQKVINQLIMEDAKTWNIIESKRPANFDLGVEIKQ